MHILKTSIFLITSLLSLSIVGCRPLKVEDHFITVESLASYHMSTPDPKKMNPPQGQEVIINWTLSREFRLYNDLRITLKILFGNLETLDVPIEVTKAVGSYTYRLMNSDYFCADGILAYKVGLFGDDQLIYEWKHQLWVDIIQFPDSYDNESTTEDEEYDENEDDDPFNDD